MKYILSDTTITDSKYDYILDAIKVYFSLDASDVPYIDLGTHTRISNLDPSIAQDLIATDVTNFISKLAKDNIEIKLENISNIGDGFTIELSFEGSSINFILK